ncbi:hypothetical protein KL925_005014 [Ogataea polymorpha]|nr:hypothetical protein KL908_004939 [Ogataea polymorpha]KAG7900058.1 hypothetical protein KL907_004820 [Ogataea polymorpha]KAG7906061.1 hypothetical protein KL906_004840 [Ogataea polymorpha]KAG7924841.1 hypothetical protein KL925_005014 [Ogataea polymorpha]KAG7932004.1 hypothetical protein KL904_004751 [Ogataea polymorpha]
MPLISRIICAYAADFAERKQLRTWDSTPIDDDARSKHYLPQFWLLLPRPPVGVITGCLSTAKPDRQASWHSHGAAGGGACLRDHLEDGLQLAIQRSTALL